MGKVKKAALERHMPTLSPFAQQFVKQATDAPLHQLPGLLDSFPQTWPMPRGDLFHWIPLLDRFDSILESFNQEYGLDKGPQTQPFTCRLLLGGTITLEGTEKSTVGLEEIKGSGFGDEGDRELVESVLQFTRVLLEHCGNRSIYASSSHINNLLHTTSLSLLRLCLKLGIRLAQRYQVARYKSHHNSAPFLLSIHYNIDLENVQRIAAPFPKPATSPEISATDTPSRGKERAVTVPTVNSSDLVALTKDDLPAATRSQLATVNLSFHDSSKAVQSTQTEGASSEMPPATPTPVRRTSALGPSRERPPVGDRSASTNDIESPVRSRETDSYTPSSTSTSTFHLSEAKVRDTLAWELVRDAVPTLPTTSHYDLLHRIRIAKAFASPNIDSQMIVEIRLLAVANLCFIYSDGKFTEKIDQPIVEEPRQFHLPQQLCELLQPVARAHRPLSLAFNTSVLLALDAYARRRPHEVADALAITANHGVLYHELRRVMASLAGDENEDQSVILQTSEWREATFDLVNSLLQHNGQHKYGEKMINAGIMTILVDALTRRTAHAIPSQEKVLQFLDSFIHGIQTALQTLANARGLDIIAELTAWQVETAIEKVKNGDVLSTEFKSKVIDYEIAFSHQSILRQLFKNTTHLFEQNTGPNDRLLRNFIDTPQILSSLRTVIQNPPIFGSLVWSGAMNIMSNFIHHEPTSYQVVAEAGLTKSLLESIIGHEVPDVSSPAANANATSDATEDSSTPNEPKIDADNDTTMESVVDLDAGQGETSVPGILPVAEVMCDIPTAFGAICLNEAGMQLFQASGALDRYFDIFLSPVHVRTMDDEGQIATAIGSSFDELSRHHPILKAPILAAVTRMIGRLRRLSDDLAATGQSGAKLWQHDGADIVLSGGSSALKRMTIGGDGNGQPAETQSESSSKEGKHDMAPSIPYLCVCFRFLEGYFNNHAMCAEFCEKGGAEIVLDLALSPSLPYNLTSFQFFSKVAQVVKIMAESRPYLVIPSLIKRLQIALVGLTPLLQLEDASSSLLAFTDLSKHTDSTISDGTSLVRSLLHVQLSALLLGRSLAPPPYTLRHGTQNNQIFASMNMTDVYLKLIDDVTFVHAACTWENLFLSQALSADQKQDTEPRTHSFPRVDPQGLVEYGGEKPETVNASTGTDGDATPQNGTALDASEHQKLLATKNTRMIRFLLAQAPVAIENLIHSMGTVIATKRGDQVPKAHAQAIAERIAKCLLRELSYRRNGDTSRQLEAQYGASLLQMIGRALLKNSHSMESLTSKESLILVLNKFYILGGFSELNSHLKQAVEAIKDVPDSDPSMNKPLRDAVHSLLTFYDQVVRSKCIVDASQSNAIMQRQPSQPEYFQPGQLLLEIRDAILPTITSVWHQPGLEDVFGETYLKLIISILQSILEGDGEERVIKRAAEPQRRIPAPQLDFRFQQDDSLKPLLDAGFDRDLAAEAMHRCNANISHAQAYCRLRRAMPQIPRFPAPQDAAGRVYPTIEGAPLPHNALLNVWDVIDEEAETQEPPASTAAPEQDDASTRDESVDADDDSTDLEFGGLGPLPTSLQMSDIQAMLGGSSAALLQELGAPIPPVPPITPANNANLPVLPTVEDLDEKRATLREALVDRCLDILGAWPTLSFQLSDLLRAAVAKAPESSDPHAEISTTLILSLTSLQGGDESKESAIKIQAYAHILALVLQDRDFFSKALDELKEHFGIFIAWVGSASEQKPADVPWIETVLLIVERLLAEDAQPPQVKWHMPSSSSPVPVVEADAGERLTTEEDRELLFSSLVDILPKIGKDTSLALSVSRILVILTRDRDLARRFSKKATLGRFFLMIRQLAGEVGPNLQTTTMLILRHIIEDTDILTQIMRSEVRGLFENQRSSRQAIDTVTYVRLLSHLVLRDSKIFVEVTKELVECPSYDGNPTRAQVLALKKQASGEQSEATQTSKAAMQNQTPSSQKTTDAKVPAADSSDGIVQFLLRELFTYKDVEDRPGQVTKDGSADTSEDRPPLLTALSSVDSEMPDAASVSTSSSEKAPDNKSSKAAFKVEDNVIFIYRCFILNCLTELVASYNRAKTDFINFSRKTDSAPATPSKPRSGMLNYMINTLLPTGSLEHRDEPAHRKRLATSNWTLSVLVALCAKTNENYMSNYTAMTATAFAELEPDLTFVRKFVLEHGLRAFKEATYSSEYADIRYARLLAMGELFNRMMVGKTDTVKLTAQIPPHSMAHQQIGRLMYEKNFISAITCAIAELDLNFPNAKRAVKYLLGPLKSLTDMGVDMSVRGDLPTSNDTGEIVNEDEDESLSATSLSDEDEEDEREQTPDLFRGSSLRMFESSADHDDEESDSDDEDEEDDEMYDDAYVDEEMEYEEEVMAEHGDVVSEDDDDLEGMGEIEGVHGDVAMELDAALHDDDMDDDSSGDDDDLDEDSDDDDDHDDQDDYDDDDHHMDEINGDDENASLADHDEDEDWEDEEPQFDDNIVIADGPGGGRDPLDQLAHLIGAGDPDDGSDRGDAIHVPMQDGVFVDELNDDDDDPEAEMEEDFEEEVVYEPEAEDEDDDDEGAWEWDNAVPAGAILSRSREFRQHHHHHHHHRHQFGDLLTALGESGHRSGFRFGRAAPLNREEEGINPLLQRDGPGAFANRPRENDPLGVAQRLNPRRTMLMRQFEGTFQEIVQAFGPPGSNHGAVLNMEVVPGTDMSMSDFRTLFNTPDGVRHTVIDMTTDRAWRDQFTVPGAWEVGYSGRGQGHRSGATTEESHAVEFRPSLSMHRWVEETRLLYTSAAQAKASRVLNAILNVLLPPAIEARRAREAQEKQQREEAEKAAAAQKEKDQATKAALEAEEKREREEREAREAEERAEAQRALEELQADETVDDDEADDDEESEDQENAEEEENDGEDAAEAPAQSDAPAANANRITVTVRGQLVDITELGIDPDYIEALPEDIREEVVFSQIAEQRQQAARQGTEPSEISREFLEALPPDIQQELLRQEAAERRRRQRSAAVAQQATARASAVALQHDMTNLDFMATLDPVLRRDVLMEADDSMLAVLPEALQEEARALVGDRRLPPMPSRIDHTGRFGHDADANALDQAIADARPRDAARAGNKQRRSVVQMLDKSGIATLLRLMFVSLNSKSRSNLHGILTDVCKNAQNRAEVISILLSILQDGTADVSAVERNFAQLSLRAKLPAGSKTPQPIKRTGTGNVSVNFTAELSPLNIVQQCLGTLNALADNSRIPSFFLSEHDTISSQRGKAAKKGKGKEVKGSRYPLNALLVLLDRSVVTENVLVMETLASLLSHVTQPLMILLRRAKVTQSESAVEAATEPAQRPTTSASDVSMADAPAATTAESAAETADTSDKQTTEAASDSKKKHRDHVPPEVPEENIRLVVNILAARECPSKTFSDTLDIIKNLSAIPGAREVFGRELIRQAQELGQTLLGDLDELCKQIDNAKDDADMQGLALTNFSSAGSKQSRLLRVLVALDHLFDQKRSFSARFAASSDEEQKLKKGILATFYDSSAFEKLWESLSACLTAIRNHGNLVNVATILLPLIEALMVMCRNSALKENANATGNEAAAGTPPPPEARMDALFFSFTEDHRKILNELIRNNPKLMNGNLSILAKNSKVLEFDNKRNYFSRKLHDRRSESRVAHPSLQLSVRRDQVFLDSFKSLYYKTGEEIKYGKLNIRFHGEEGVDAGGVSREWFAAMARQMFNGDYALFNPVASDRTTFHPNALSEINPEHLLFFKFIGRIIGKALYEGRVLDCHFSRAVYRRILGKSVSLKDMETLDLDYYRSLVWILENDITDVTFETFSVDVDRFGVTDTIDLIENGRNVAVTEDNKQEYVRLVVEYRLIKSVQAQLDEFLTGFHEIIPSSLISIFNEQELELLISGLPDIDVEDWKNNTDYHNYQANSPQIQWFWRAVRSFDKEEKAKLLQFVTGTSKVPLNGFKELEGMNGFSKFNIHRDYSSKEKLPSSHTCFNQLDLPEYDSYEHLRHQLYTAITAGSEYFGFA